MALTINPKDFQLDDEIDGHDGDYILQRPPGTRIGQAQSSVRAARVRVDGKFFARGSQRLRLQGITYGPFAANVDGDTFPTPQRLRDDLQGMRDAGLNALRTYHVPPEWFLHLRMRDGIGVLIDVPWSASTSVSSIARRRGARPRAAVAAGRQALL